VIVYLRLMGANLQLSPEESALVMDAGWILTKNSVMEKVVGMMAELSEVYKGLWVAGIEPGNAKISRGENYLGLPWVILDYPRIFGREDVLAIRTMFWWGHPFSVTLHLKGRYQALYLPVIERRRVSLAAAGFHVAIGEDEWRHELAADNYAPIGEVRDIGASRPFLKLSAAVRLDRYEAAPRLLASLFKELASIPG
jgi:hypothetical protein